MAKTAFTFYWKSLTRKQKLVLCQKSAEIKRDKFKKSESESIYQQTSNLACGRKKRVSFESVYALVEASKTKGYKFPKLSFDMFIPIDSDFNKIFGGEK